MINSIQAKAADAFAAFHGYTAAVCKLRNTSAVSIDYLVGEVTTALAAGASAVIDTASSTSEVSIRRTDLSAVPVSVSLDFGLTADEAYELAASSSGPVAAADITDAGATGIDLVKAGTPAQGREALEVGTLATASKSGAYTVGTDSAAELLGGVIYVSGAAVVTLSAVSAGKSCTVIVTSPVAVTLTPNAADRFVLDGSALSDGVSIVSTGSAGDVAEVTYESASGWHVSTNGWSAV